ncbi:MAG: DUF3786 domain-containing protein [Bacillota bacterium]
MCNPVNAYQETVKKFVTLDPVDIAARSGAIFDEHNRTFEIAYFGRNYIVDLEGRVWRADASEKDVPFNDRTLIVQYLSEASGLPPRGAWMSFLELPEGIHHFAPFQTDATTPLAETFGSAPAQFGEAAVDLGGRPLSLGDHSFYIPALPKIPLAVVLWEGDDEFAAKSNILFDSVAPTHLTTAALWVLGVELAHKMISHLNHKAGREISITWLEGVKKED